MANHIFFSLQLFRSSQDKVENNVIFLCVFNFRLDPEKALKAVTSATRVFPEDAGK